MSTSSRVNIISCQHQLVSTPSHGNIASCQHHLMSMSARVNITSNLLTREFLSSEKMCANFKFFTLILVEILMQEKTSTVVMLPLMAMHLVATPGTDGHLIHLLVEMKPMPNPTLTFWLWCDLPSVQSSYLSHSVCDICVMEIRLRICTCNNNFVALLRNVPNAVHVN